MTVWSALSSRGRRWLLRVRRGARGEPLYRSPKEIALRNAADSLGVTLGDYYPDVAELPADLLESRTGGPDAASLDASREELLTYIAGQRAQRRRRRLRVLGVSTMLVAVIGLGVLIGAGSRPLGSGEWGPEVPRDAWRAAGTPSADGRGVPSNNQTGAFAELDVGHKTIIGSTYLDEAGDFCLKVADVVDGVTKMYSVGGCTSATQIAREFSREPAILIGFGVGRRHILLHGLARRDLRALAVRRPKGQSLVAISGPWVPSSRASPGATALKIFLIKVPFKSGRLREEGLRAPTQPGALEFAAILEDGRVQRVRGMWERHRPSVRRLVDPIAPAGWHYGLSQKPS